MQQTLDLLRQPDGLAKIREQNLLCTAEEIAAILAK
jgi:hypothetical protein